MCDAPICLAELPFQGEHRPRTGSIATSVRGVAQPFDEELPLCDLNSMPEARDIIILQHGHADLSKHGS